MPDSLTWLLTDLKKENSLKAWSLITTFFGDSIAPRGVPVSATTIQAAMALCDIGGGTVRTALSRLGKDGWVEREKFGRNSFYRLSSKGAMQSSDASKLIYSAPIYENTVNNATCLIITPPGYQLPSTEPAPVRLKQDVYLLSQQFPKINTLHKDQCLIADLSSHPLPGWVEDALLPAPLTHKYRELQRRTEKIDTSKPIEPADALALRTILIHEWRRLRLRQGSQTQCIYPAALQSAHSMIAKLYHALTPGAEQWLQDHGHGPNGPLPPPDKNTSNRFR